MVARGWREGNGKGLLHASGVSLWGEENVPGLRSGEDRTTS